MLKCWAICGGREPTFIQLAAITAVALKKRVVGEMWCWRNVSFGECVLRQTQLEKAWRGAAEKLSAAAVLARTYMDGTVQ